jgi:hypothetical protein
MGASVLPIWGLFDEVRGVGQFGWHFSRAKTPALTWSAPKIAAPNVRRGQFGL